MAEPSDDAKDIDQLYAYGERLNVSKDKSQNVKDYESIIKAATSPSEKARQLAAQLIPMYFKFFPGLSVSAVDAQLDLCEAEEPWVRVQAIQGLPLFCKDTPEHLSKIVDILVQLLDVEDNVELDAVYQALLSLLRQDVKASLTALFKHIESVDESIMDENLRERTLIFIRDKVFPLKAELLKPPEQMERHITDLIKRSLQDGTGAEFKISAVLKLLLENIDTFNPTTIDTASTTRATTTRRKMIRWSSKDDKGLAVAYLNVRKDAVVRNDQSKMIYWQRVSEFSTKIVNQIKSRGNGTRANNIGIESMLLAINSRDVMTNTKPRVDLMTENVSKKLINCTKKVKALNFPIGMFGILFMINQNGPTVQDGKMISRRQRYLKIEHAHFWVQVFIMKMLRPDQSFKKLSRSWRYEREIASLVVK